MQTASTFYVAIIAALGLLALLAVFLVISLRFKRVGPDEAMVVYGFGLLEPKVAVGGGAFVLPMLQASRTISLKIQPVEFSPKLVFRDAQGKAVYVQARAQFKVRPDPDSVRTAASDLALNASEMTEAVGLMLEERLREAVSRLTAEEMVRQPQVLAERVRPAGAAELDKRGLELVSLVIRDASLQAGYTREKAVIGRFEGDQAVLLVGAEERRLSESRKVLPWRP